MHRADFICIVKACHFRQGTSPFKRPYDKTFCSPFVHLTFLHLLPIKDQFTQTTLNISLLSKNGGEWDFFLALQNITKQTNKQKNPVYKLFLGSEERTRSVVAISVYINQHFEKQKEIFHTKKEEKNNNCDLQHFIKINSILTS